MNEFEKLNSTLHKLGRFLMITSIILLIIVPFVFGMVYGVSPDGEGFLAGYLRVAVIYLPVSLVEFLV